VGDRAVDNRNRRDDRRSIHLSILWVVAAVAVLGVARWLVPVGVGTRTTETEIAAADESYLALSLGGGSVRLPQLCTFRSLFGYECPGCGMTRSFVYTARLRFAEAWAMHPAGTLLAAYLAVSVPHRLWRIGRLSAGRRSMATWRWEIGLVGALAIVSYGRWFWRCWESWGGT